MTRPADSGKSSLAYRIGYIALLFLIIAGGSVWAVVRVMSSQASAVNSEAGADANTAAGLPPPETLATVFAPCAHCHEIGEGAHSMVGPSLAGVIGRKAGTYPHYPYSKAMRDSGITWDAATLSRFVADPQAVVPGTRMYFAGLPQKEIAPLVAYIVSVSAKGEQQGQAVSPPAAVATH